MSQLTDKSLQLERKIKQIQPETPTIYFCDICQTTKNSRVDGEVYQIKVSIYPNRISNVCPSCRPNVVMVPDDDWSF